jgi:hypothetical protein
MTVPNWNRCAQTMFDIMVRAGRLASSLLRQFWCQCSAARQAKPSNHRSWQLTACLPQSASWRALCLSHK